MSELKARVKGNILTIEIPLTDIKEAPVSSSGKNKVIATTNGFNWEALSEIQAGISLNVITKRGL